MQLASARKQARFRRRETDSSGEGKEIRRRWDACRESRLAFRVTLLFRWNRSRNYRRILSLSGSQQCNSARPHSKDAQTGPPSGTQPVSRIHVCSFSRAMTNDTPTRRIRHRVMLPLCAIVYPRISAMGFYGAARWPGPTRLPGSLSVRVTADLALR